MSTKGSTMTTLTTTTDVLDRKGRICDRRIVYLAHVSQARRDADLKRRLFDSGRISDPRDVTLLDVGTSWVAYWSRRAEKA